MILTVNGVNMVPFLAYRGGIRWQRSDVEDPEAGRTLDGAMHRDRVATKIRLDVKCRPLRSNETPIVLKAILPEYVTVTYTDPMDGEVTKTMYANNNPAAFMLLQEDGTEWWEDITFPLIEQ